MSGPQARLKIAFKKARVIAPLHTNGPVAFTRDGTRLFTCVGEQVLLTDVYSGVEICRFKGDSTSITSLAVSPSSTHLAVFYTSSTLRIYELPSPNLEPRSVVHPSRVISKSHEAPVHVCLIDPSSTLLASGSADGVVKVWDLQRGYVTHMFKGHGGVVSALAFNYPRETAAARSNPSDVFQLITASADNRLRIFDLTATASRSAGAKAEAILDGHVSVPRGLDVSPDGRWLISGGRDSVVLIWDLLGTPSSSSNTTHKAKGKGKVSDTITPTLFKTIPVLERVEAVGFLAPGETISPGRVKFYTGGEKGVIRIWDAWEGKVLATHGVDVSQQLKVLEEPREIIDVLYTASTSSISSLHADQNILTYSLSTGLLIRQHIGFNDEIIDARLLSSSTTSSPRDTHLALATNSSLIKVYDTRTLDARLLSAHSDMVLCLDVGSDGTLLASGSKDKSARIWLPIPHHPTTPSDTENIEEVEWRCAAIAEGHAESIGAIALSQKDTSGRFMFTGSQDRTVKMWDLAVLPSKTAISGSTGTEVLRLKSLVTLKAHEKDINSLDVAPNDRLLATGSQDKTINVYEIDYVPSTSTKPARGELRLLGTCKGHKRGVWDVKFSKTERYLASGSGDKTVRLWSLDSFSCLKTFEGHTNTVLRVDFISHGRQLVSAASDGLVKLWNIGDEECVTSLDNHEDKIWALAISSDETTIVSGAADSVVTFWTDCTEEIQIEKENARAELVLKEQDFQNFVALRDYRSAILLALSMNQPGRLLNLFRTLRANASSSDSTTLSDATSITGSASVDEIIRTLAALDLARLLTHVRDWNATARTSDIAQSVLHAVLKLRTPEDIVGAFETPSFVVLDGTGASAGAGDNDDADDSGGKEVTRSKPPTVGLKELVDGLLPYTERHLARVDQLVQDSYVVDYVLGEMDMGLVADGSLMDVDVSA